jgi:predicted dehydrogenase
MTQVVRFGILGCGRIAHDFVCATVGAPNIEIEAVGARSKDTAKQFAEEHNIRTHGDLHELVSNPNVDVIYVGTTQSAHYENTILALNHGKHVLCEKTFAMTYKQAEHMVSLAKEKNLFIMEANWMLCMPAIQQAFDAINNGTIGDVQMVQASLGFNSQGRELDAKLGGGSLLACGVYCVQLASAIFKRDPTTIQATGTVAKGGADGHTSALLTYDIDNSNRIAVCSSSFISSIPGDACVIGSNGRVTFNDLFVCPKTITISTSTEQIITNELPLNKSKFNFPNSEGLVFEALHVADCIRKGLKESPLVPTELTLRSMRILDQIRKIVGVNFEQD